MTFTSIQLPAAQVRWVLSGPAGQHLDSVVAALVGAGVAIETITAGTHYRLRGGRSSRRARSAGAPAELLDVLGEQLGQVEGFSVLREMPPTDTVNMRSTLAPSHAFRRSVEIHGDPGREAASFVARAIDHRLAVESVGIGRWSVSGRTRALVDWLAAVYVKPVEEVLALFGWTAETIAAEDAATPAVSITLPPLQVAVTLPDRKTTTTFERDADDEIVSALQFETNAP